MPEDTFKPKIETGKRFIKQTLQWAMLLIALGSIYFASLHVDLTPTAIVTRVQALGFWGGLLIVAMMTIAVVVSPIPSAPIAIASGAAFGHYQGAAYVALGSEFGAVIACLLARYFGREFVQKRLGAFEAKTLLGSQNTLTLTVFTSRMLPFISFDAMSYAAGLSKLKFWRFVLATFAGIIPASFVLAHLGSKANDMASAATMAPALLLGLLVSAPILLIALRSSKRQN